MKSNEFLENAPYFIGEVGGIAFYECPMLGDESPLWAVYQGEAVLSHYWELPSDYEVEDDFQLTRELGI